ncbi:MAG: hypothetical protein JWN04_4507 [Myxococcaceae bacterium]|nr:hypothetical protein [Myxococcaceae bacterium]
MQGNLSHSAHTYSSSVSLGGNHGYRFEGDTAILNAELAIAPHVGTQGAQHWALQLWACETPYQGGPLRGLKVAEAELALPVLPTLTLAGEHEHTRLETAAFAHLPPAQGEYAMVLVLASGDRGRYDQVHDFSNYAARQQFTGPRLEGNVGYRFDGDSVVLSADGVRNSRSDDNLSGSLSLELWALSTPYEGGPLQGTLLAQSPLGRLAGQAELRYVEQRVALNQAPCGDWQLALVLTEWTDAAGYVTRDFCNFAAQHHVAAPLGNDADAVVTAAAAPFAPSEAAAPAPATPAEVDVIVEPKGADAAVTPEAAPAQASVAAPGPLASKVPTRPPSTQVPNALKARVTPVAPDAKPVFLAAAAQLAPGARISVQTASVEELARVEGLNKKLAQAIVKARPFQALEDVTKVRGIGDKMLQRLRDQLTL